MKLDDVLKKEMEQRELHGIDYSINKEPLNNRKEWLKIIVLSLILVISLLALGASWAVHEYTLDVVVDHLSTNSGTYTVLAITLVIVSLLGIVPLIFLAINMGKQGYNKYR